MQAQVQLSKPPSPLPYSVRPSIGAGSPHASGGEMYPSLTEFMGMEITSEMLASQHAKQLVPSYSAASAGATGHSMIAPLSSQSTGLAKANVTHGIRELILCKGADGKIGLRCQVKDLTNNFFVGYV